jgi:hypothetical protein
MPAPARVDQSLLTTRRARACSCTVADPWVAPAVAEGDGIKLLEAFNGRTSATPPSEKVLRCVAVRTCHVTVTITARRVAVSPLSTPSPPRELCCWIHSQHYRPFLRTEIWMRPVVCACVCVLACAQLLQGQLSRARERQSADVAAASAARASVIEVADDATNRRHLASSVEGALVTVWALQPVWEGTVKRAGDLDLEKKLGTSVFLHHAPSCTVHHGPLGLTVLACVACGQCRSLCFRATCWQHRCPRAAYKILRGTQAP